MAVVIPAWTDNSGWSKGLFMSISQIEAAIAAAPTVGPVPKPRTRFLISELHLTAGRSQLSRKRECAATTYGLLSD
jgi:hypothetical protein